MLQVAQCAADRSRTLLFPTRVAPTHTRPISPRWTWVCISIRISASGPPPRSKHHYRPTSRARRRRSEILAARPCHRFRPATIFWNWPTRTVRRRPGTINGCRSIRPHFNAKSARSASHGRTTSDHICEPIPTSVRLSARCAAKRLPASMIGRDMRVYIAGKRNSSAGATWGAEAAGAVRDASHAPMLSGVTSDPKRGASASNRCWTRRLWNGSGNWSSR